MGKYTFFSKYALPGIALAIVGGGGLAWAMNSFRAPTTPSVEIKSLTAAPVPNENPFGDDAPSLGVLENYDHSEKESERRKDDDREDEEENEFEHEDEDENEDGDEDGGATENAGTGSGTLPPPPPASPVPPAQTISRAALALHNTRSDCWVAYKGVVYDLTAWLPQHPGTSAAIVPYCGTAEEFAAAFSGQHGTSQDPRIKQEGTSKGALQ